MKMIPKRLKGSIQGLNDMINYINTIEPTKDMVIVEIGSWVGTSAVEFARRFKKVICIDPFIEIKNTITNKYNMRDVEELFDYNIRGYDNIKKIKDYSYNVAQKLDEKVDVVYIDGNHHYISVLKDIHSWLPKTTKFICGHDYYHKFPGVIKAVNEMFKKPDKTFKDTSWLINLIKRRSK